MQKINYRYISWTLLGILILVAAYGLWQVKTFGASLVQNRLNVMPLQVNSQVSTIDLLTATSTNATSTSIDVLGAKKITIFGITEGHVSTSSIKQPLLSVTATGKATTTDYIFDADAGVNDATYFRLNSLIQNLTNTNLQTLTRVNVMSLSATTTMVSIDLGNTTLARIRCHLSNFNILGDSGIGAICRAIIQY